eukprot:g3847.t1
MFNLSCRLPLSFSLLLSLSTSTNVFLTYYIEQLNETKRIEFLEKKKDTELAKAKQMMKKKNKQKAKYHLKKKKFYEKQVDNLYNQVMNLEQQVMQLQQASTNVVVVDGLRTARDAHQKIMGEMDIDKIDEIKDDLADALDMGQEISNALGEEMGMGLDEDELLGELDELEEEEAANVMLGVPSAPTSEVASDGVALDMPAAPTGNVELDELAELEGMMAAA